MIAKESAAARLCLIHYHARGREKQMLAEAREIFPGTFLAGEGQNVEIT